MHIRHAEVDDHLARRLLPVFHHQRLAVTFLQLRDQRQRIMVVDEAHGLARLQRVHGAENRRMTEALGNAARVKGMDLPFHSHLHATPGEISCAVTAADACYEFEGVAV